MKSGETGALADRRGLTLLEVIIALTIAALIVGVLLTSLRVGVHAWEAGERRAATQQEVRALFELLTEALSSAIPLRGRLGEAPDRVVLFQGERAEVRFVTTASPLVLDAPTTPFHAVTLRHTSDNQLRLIERLVPADEPFGGGPETVLARSVTELRVEYRDNDGLWADRWDPRLTTGLPAAVRVQFTFREGGRPERTATLLVPIPLASATAPSVSSQTPFGAAPLIPQPSGGAAPLFPQPFGGIPPTFPRPPGGTAPLFPQLPAGPPAPAR
jgi:general secretion pathway protein J